MAECCPTCGSTVVVIATDEGTCHYEPVRTEDVTLAMQTALRYWFERALLHAGEQGQDGYAALLRRLQTMGQGDG